MVNACAPRDFALLSVFGGWIGIERFDAFLAPSVGEHAVEGGSTGLEIVLSFLAVLVAALGWFIADRLYRQRPERPQQLAASFPPAYKLLVNKFYVDEIYGFAVVKPLLAFRSSFWSGSSTSPFWAVLHGCLPASLRLAAPFSSAGSRAICVPTRRWLALGAAALLLFVLVPWNMVLAGIFGVHLGMAGH